MTLEALDNLVRIGQLKEEPPDQREFDGMLVAGRRALKDAQVPGLSDEGRFSLAYQAGHALALAALRWHGYRSESRYIVFQCLQHTLGLDATKWRILDLCHRQRNLAEYEGHLEIPAQLIEGLIETVGEILPLVESLER